MAEDQDRISDNTPVEGSTRLPKYPANQPIETGDELPVQEKPENTAPVAGSPEKAEENIAKDVAEANSDQHKVVQVEDTTNRKKNEKQYTERGESVVFHFC